MSSERKNKKPKGPDVRPIPYPFRGVSKGEPYALPEEGFCREALNARTFDQLSDRSRGGPRSGTFKWHQHAVHSTDHYVQDINSLIPFGSGAAYTTPDNLPRAGDPGGNPGVPDEVTPGYPWVPGLHGDGPWYVNPKKCSDDTPLDIWIEWGLLPLFLNAFVYNGICYYVNPFDKLTDEPPAILLPGDPLLGAVRQDSCDTCSGVLTCSSCSSARNAASVAFFNLDGSPQPILGVGGSHIESYPWFQDLPTGVGYECGKDFVPSGGKQLAIRIEADGTVWALVARTPYTFGDNANPNPTLANYKNVTGSLTCVGGNYSGTFRVDHIDATPAYYAVVTF